MKHSFKIVLALLLIVNCQLSIVNLSAQPKREFRAAWITTVWAIDWPKTSYGSSANAARQQAEMMQLVDTLAHANMNACFFQVRGFSDAMYNSQYEPWSQYLTGARGGVPSYDPLQFLIEYAHYKGIEVYAWLNPYRYSSSSSNYGTLPTDYSNTHPEWLVQCGDITILNPALPEVRTRVAEVVSDIVRHYDVDGIVFDDYFHQSGYQNSYDDAQYAATGNGMTRANWRRNINNLMVREVRDSIKAIKPYVNFGIGPAGVAGAANTSAPVYDVTPIPCGSDWQYNGIYADPLAWYDQKLIDYMAPQVYWKIGSGNDYQRISQWWSYIASHFNRHVYISPTLSNLVGDNTAVTGTKHHADETVAEIECNRQYDRQDAPGVVLYSMYSGITLRTFYPYLRANANPHPALVPAMSWYVQGGDLHVSNITRSGNLLSWTAPQPNLRYAVYAIPTAQVGQPAQQASSANLLGCTYDPHFELPVGVTGTIAVSVLDRYGNEYPARTIDNTVWGSAPAATLTYPANNASLLLPSYFSWQTAAGADSYFFQLSKNADFSTIDYQHECTDTQFYVGLIEWLQDNETYYWRIMTRQINAADSFSEVRSFTGAYYHILYPSQDERDVSRVLTVLTDSVADPSASYFFEFCTDATFASSKIVYSATTSVPRLTVPSNTLQASTYYNVRATVTYSGIEAISEIIAFRTEAQYVPVPVITSPTEGATVAGPDVTIQWQDQPSGGFRVELSSSETFAPRKTKSATEEMGATSHTYTGIADGVWYVRVKAVADGAYTDPSDVVTFTVGADATGLQSANCNLQPVSKILENGVVYILRDGHKYTTLGTLVE